MRTFSPFIVPHPATSPPPPLTLPLSFSNNSQPSNYPSNYPKITLQSNLTYIEGEDQAIFLPFIYHLSISNLLLFPFQKESYKRNRQVSHGKRVGGRLFRNRVGDLNNLAARSHALAVSNSFFRTATFFIFLNNLSLLDFPILQSRNLFFFS